MQNVALERKRSVRVEVPGKKEGKTKLEMQVGFVDVAHMDIEKVFLDDRQVSKLKCIPARQITFGDYYEKNEEHRFKMYRRDNSGELVEDDNGTERKKLKGRSQRTVEERWLGYFPATRTVEEVPWNFVEDNFPTLYLRQVRSICSTNRSFVQVPPGESRYHPQGVIVSTDGQAPAIKHKQKLGEKTCLTASFASALHFVGLKQIASELFRCSKMIINRPDTWPRFAAFLVTKSPHLCSFNVELSGWDIFKDKKDQLISVTLQGSDGKCDHAVAVCGKWLFDSNFDKAMELSREALDLCCSSHETEAKFVKVECARCFPEYKLALR